MRTEKQSGIAKIILENPSLKLYTLDTKELDELACHVSALDKDEKVKAVIITGVGKCFCAGADIKKMKDMSPTEAMELSRKGQETFRAIETMNKPVIAAVNGYAYGGGCELALACDWIYAAESDDPTEGAKFGQPEITLGIIPGWGATWRLPERVGIAQAKELIFTGKIIDAKEAHRIGLVSKVFPDKNFMDEVEKVAKELAGLSPLMLNKVKRLVGTKYDNALRVHIAGLNERAEFGQCFETDDQKEGMSAFLEKREAKFKGS